jgi:hypothetical protein
MLAGCPRREPTVERALRYVGFEPTVLRRMGAGIAFSGLAWIAAGALQLALDDGHALSVAWQVLPSHAHLPHRPENKVVLSRAYTPDTPSFFPGEGPVAVTPGGPPGIAYSTMSRCFV